jgi:hypothetical protein
MIKMKVTKEMAVEYCEKIGVNPESENNVEILDSKFEAVYSPEKKWQFIREILQKHFDMRAFYLEQKNKQKSDDGNDGWVKLNPFDKETCPPFDKEVQIISEKRILSPFKFFNHEEYGLVFIHERKGFERVDKLISCIRFIFYASEVTHWRLMPELPEGL